MTISSQDPICSEVINIFHELYQIKDTAIPPLVIGGYYFSGCVYKLYVGHVFGKVSIDLSQVIRDMPELRLQQLLKSETELPIYLNQVCNLFDFGLGLNDIKYAGSNELAIKLFDGGKSFLESAVKTALDGVDREASMHNCFLAAELLMKGFLAFRGFNSEQLKKLSHNLHKIACELCKYCPAIEHDRVERAIDYLPKSVQERYEVNHYSNEDTGKAIMSVQYLAGSLIGYLSGRNLSSGMMIDGTRYENTATFP